MIFAILRTHSYVKLQQAYVSESVAIGTWSVIGYKGPGHNTNASEATGGASSKTNYFEYKDATGYSGNTVALTGSSSVVGFTATNIAKLNDCEQSSSWTITVAPGTAAGEATFTPNTLGQDCLQLTPNWNQIGK
ncbi:hypothetical protein SAMN02745108_00266 [Fibrobacter intestinalis]|uniref:Uncharacterized protein n=1 Tax=Fibrobacter intestinalis TaxID=28122 RepID=A0A1T4K3A0_9BACT|nr:hypothetical protein BGW94_1890 [Fibrobacter sp. NR9]SJZ36823.1 hypothetical protein SAMN02745108_00266 [Fibrobacter intestinalis]